MEKRMNHFKDKFKNLFSTSSSLSSRKVAVLYPKPEFPVSNPEIANLYPYLILDHNPLENWDILNEIGDGAFSKVFRARNRKTGLVAAAKVIEKCDKEDLKENMIEIEILKSCEHKNIIKFYEAYYFKMSLWIFIEYCEIGAIDLVLLTLNKNINENQIKYVINETLQALMYLHDKKYVIHRDMKAGNILLTENGDVKLADFGVSAKNSIKLQRRNTFIGTPYWMSPEIIRSETDEMNTYDYKTDIWSLGITCIELAELAPPHSELSPSRVLIRILKSDSPNFKNPNQWSKDFQDFVSKCLLKNQEQRFNSIKLLEHSFLKNAEQNKNEILSLIKEYKHSQIMETIDASTELDSSSTFDDEEIKNMSSDSLSSKNGGVVLLGKKVIYHDNNEHDNKLSMFEESIYDDILNQVMKSEYEAPSIPEIILQVLKEIYNLENS